MTVRACLGYKEFRKSPNTRMMVGIFEGQSWQYPIRNGLVSRTNFRNGYMRALGRQIGRKAPVRNTYTLVDCTNIHG